MFVGPNIHSGSGQVDCSPLAIVHFHLPSLGIQSASALAVHAALTPFLLPTEIFDISADLGIHETEPGSDNDMVVDSGPSTKRKAKSIKKKPTTLPKVTAGPVMPTLDSSRYMYRDVPFSLATDEQMAKYARYVKTLVDELEQ